MDTNSKRYVRRYEPEEGVSYTEKLYAQCLVCGVIMLGIMFLCIIDRDLSHSLRYNIKAALTEQAAPDTVKGISEYLSGRFSFITDSVDSVKNFLPTIKGKPTVENAINTTPEEPIPSAMIQPAPNIDSEADVNADTSTNTNALPGESTPIGDAGSQYDPDSTDFRIDEDLLSQMQ